MSNDPANQPGNVGHNPPSVSSPSDRNHVDLLVVGAGLSGLTLAASWSNQNPEGRLCVLESADRTGGVIHSERVAVQDVGEFLIDHGADMFATEPPAAMDLCHEIGADSDLVSPLPDLPPSPEFPHGRKRRGAMIVKDGQLQPIPSGFVLMRATQTGPMLSTPLLSPTQKVRFLAEGWMPTRSSDEDESVAAFVRRRMGNGVLDRMVAPLVAGIYTADIERLSMKATMGPIWKMEKEFGSLAAAAKHRKSKGGDEVERQSAGARYGNFRGFPGGMVELIQKIQKKIPSDFIRTNTPVTSLQRNESGWTVSCVSGDADTGGKRESIHAKNIVLATPARVTAKLLKEAIPAAASELASIESASAAIVVLGIRRDQIEHPIGMFGFVVPPCEGRQILAGSFASHKFDGRAPEDHVLVRVFIGGVLQKNLLEKNDDELVRIAEEELASLIGFSGQPTITRVIRWNDAMPQYNLGHLDRVEKIESEIDRHPGLHLLGNWRGGVGIAPVIRSARSLADHLS